MQSNAPHQRSAPSVPTPRSPMRTATPLARLALLITTMALSRSAWAQEAEVFQTAQAVGREVQQALLWLSGLASVIGFMMAGHAFSSGDIERGKTMLKGTLLGSVCIFGAVGLVKFIQTKFGTAAF